jgi:hypothetical protein
MSATGEHSGESVPATENRERTPPRTRMRRQRAVTSGIEWLPPDQVPGAVLSAESQRALAEHDRKWRAHHARARVSGGSYVIYR